MAGLIDPAIPSEKPFFSGGMFLPVTIFPLTASVNDYRDTRFRAEKGPGRQNGISP
jgi:hypothetical protein